MRETGDDRLAPPCRCEVKGKVDHKFKLACIPSNGANATHLRPFCIASYVSSCVTFFPASSSIQFCFGTDLESTKISVLDGFRDRLEKCRKSLSGFLEERRRSFARFYFLSDTMLLRALGTVLEHGPEVVLPTALRQLLPSVHKVTVETTPTVLDRKATHRSLSAASPPAERRGGSPGRTGAVSPVDLASLSGPSSLPATAGTFPHLAKSTDLYITAIVSKEGERLRLAQPVSVSEDLAEWCGKLLRVTGETLHSE